MGKHGKEALVNENTLLEGLFSSADMESKRGVKNQ